MESACLLANGRFRSLLQKPAPPNSDQLLRKGSWLHPRRPTAHREKSRQVSRSMAAWILVSKIFSRASSSRPEHSRESRLRSLKISGSYASPIFKRSGLLAGRSRGLTEPVAVFQALHSDSAAISIAATSERIPVAAMPHPCLDPGGSGARGLPLIFYSLQRI